MAESTGNYALVSGTTYFQRLWYIHHRLGIWSNVVISAQYINADGEQFTKQTIIAALRAVVEAHPPLRHVFVQRPSSKKGRHGLHTAALRVINLEHCIEYLNTEVDAKVTSEDLERFHNEWLWTADEPDLPFWKLYVKGRNIVFVFSHAVCDGMGAVAFHREFLAALNSAKSATVGKAGTAADPQDALVYANDMAQPPLDPVYLWTGTYSIMEIVWTHVVYFFMELFYGKSRLFSGLPPARPHIGYVGSATAVAEPHQRTVTKIASYRIPAARMTQILTACRSHDTTFTPLLLVMITIVLATDYYPDAKVGASRFAYDLRPWLPMSRVGGGTSNGIMVNASGNGETWHKLEPFRRVLSVQGENANSSIDSTALWSLVKDYKEGMSCATNGKGIRYWSGVRLVSPDLEDTVGTLPQIARYLRPTYGVSNIGAFFGDANEERPENGERWRIEDLQFSSGVVNGTQGSQGIFFHAGGTKGGDTVINAPYEDGIITREMAEGILERVVARLYEII